MTWLKLVPVWCWWALVLLAVGGLQQLRVQALQGEVGQAKAAGQEVGEKLAACRETRANLLVQALEQNQALKDLKQAEQQRQDRAQQAQQEARVLAEQDYQAANRLQQERTGGDACAASTSVIDQELGL